MNKVCQTAFRRKRNMPLEGGKLKPPARLVVEPAAVTSVREALPSLQQWNPTRILPETMMPLISFISSYIIYPITGDYIEALSIGFAVFISLIIAIYVGMVGALLKKLYCVTGWLLPAVLFCFFAMHYMAYLKETDGNYHVLYGGNVTCHFYYLRAALWNFILVLYFMWSRIGKIIPWYKRPDYICCGVILVGCYLAINSNLWHSIILMSYFGTELLFELINAIYKKQGEIWRIVVKKYIKEQFPMIFTIVIWFISMFFEINGGRAKWEGHAESSLQVRASIKMFFASMDMINPKFVVILLIVNIVALMFALMKWRNSGTRSFLLRQLKKLVIIAMTILFLILVASKVSPGYLKNPTVMVSWMLWILFFSVESFVYVLGQCHRIIWALPLAIYILIFNIIVDKSTYAENYSSSLPPSAVKALDDDIIAQVKAAEALGETVTIHS